jgi:antitoxin ParD1/3/4
MNVSLPERMKHWVEDQMKDGKYANTSDYVRHLIRRDQERAEAVAELQAELDKGLEGEAKPFDFAEFKARMRAEYEGR